jgi:hypothetical protein
VRLEAEIEADHHAILQISILKDLCPFAAAVLADWDLLPKVFGPVNDTFMNDIDNEIRNETRLLMLRDAAQRRLWPCNYYLWSGPLQMECMGHVTRVAACVVLGLVIGSIELVWYPWTIAIYFLLAATGMIWSVYSSNFSLRQLNDTIMRLRRDQAD